MRDEVTDLIISCRSRSASSGWALRPPEVVGAEPGFFRLCSWAGSPTPSSDSTHSHSDSHSDASLDGSLGEERRPGLAKGGLRGGGLRWSWTLSSEQAVSGDPAACCCRQEQLQRCTPVMHGGRPRVWPSCQKKVGRGGGGGGAMIQMLRPRTHLCSFAAARCRAACALSGPLQAKI